MGKKQDDELPALDDQQLKSLLEEADEESVKPAHTPKNHQDHANVAYISWLGGDASPDKPEDEPSEEQPEHHEEPEEPEEPEQEQSQDNEDYNEPRPPEPKVVPEALDNFDNSPFERLYSANPELFAGMQVGEFIPHARELRKIEKAENQIRAKADEVTAMIKKLDNYHRTLEAKAEAKHHEAEAFLDRYKSDETDYSSDDQ